MKKYTALFLDIDNTFLNFDMAEAAAIRKVLSNYSLPFDDVTIRMYSFVNRKYWEAFERGDIPKSDIFTGRFKTLLEILGEERDYSKMSTDYFDALSEGSFKMENADEVLTYLREQGYKLYATTNGHADTQYRRIRNSGIEKYFDDIFVSETTGHQKPEKEYFDYVINNIDEKDISKMLVVGDSQSSDILGGINSGIDTCWFDLGKAKPIYKSEYTIKSLLDLKNIL